MMMMTMMMMVVVMMMMRMMRMMMLHARCVSAASCYENMCSCIAISVALVFSKSIIVVSGVGYTATWISSGKGRP